MKWWHLDRIEVNTDSDWVKTFRLLYYTFLHQIHSSVWVLVGKLYHEYGIYLAISHTNIEIPLESSELTGSRLIQIISGQRAVVPCTSKQIHSFRLVLGHGWVYLTTEGITSLAPLTKS
jgi:hypothetical protein